MSLSEELCNGLVGQRVGFGQCGSLTSDFFQYQTGFNFADSVSNPAPRLATAPHDGYFATAWDVYNQVDWNALGYERIDKPDFGSVRDDDIFFISPRAGLPTGHTGLVASISGGNITTFEQNVMDALYVQKLPNENSWSWYGGFDGIVRKKQPDKQQEETGEIEMMLFKIVDKTGAYKSKWFVSNGTHLRYIRTPRMLASYQNQYAKMNLKTDNIYSSELFGKKGEFDEKNIIW